MTAILELTWTDEYVIQDDLRLVHCNGHMHIFLCFKYEIFTFPDSNFDFQCGLKFLDPLVHLKSIVGSCGRLKSRHRDVFWRHFVFNITNEGLGKLWLDVQWWSSSLKTFLILITLKCLKMFIEFFLLLLWMVPNVDKVIFLLLKLLVIYIYIYA